MIDRLSSRDPHTHDHPHAATTHSSGERGAAWRRGQHASDPASEELAPPLIDDTESAENRDLVERLESRHADVLAHEMAHLSAAGAFAKGGATYTFQIGPDGKAYAIGGSVRVDMSPIPGNPRATIAKMAAIRAAALAPSDPSPEDLSVASRAAQIEALARDDLQQLQQMTADPAMRRAAGQYTPAEASRGAFIATKA